MATPAQLANLKRGGSPGRPKGAKGNYSLDRLRQSILDAYEMAGAEQYLLRQAEENPKDFLAFVSKVVPRTVDTTISGPGGGPIQVDVASMTLAEKMQALDECIKRLSSSSQ